MENESKVKNMKQNIFRGQAIIEFAIVLPILLLILVGILEVGRMVFIYSAVSNASRNAVRYASAYGLNNDGLHKYNDCSSIKSVAYQSAYLVPDSDVSITIRYYASDGSTSKGVCDAGSGEDGDISVTTGDIVEVQVSASYSPMVNIVPLDSRSITTTSRRTILGIIDINN